MRTKTRNVFILVLVATLCSIMAIFSWKTPTNTASATTETNVFEMQEGASIRTADNAGLRFRVKMSEDVKDKVVDGTAELGFVISLTKYFDQVTDGKYINVDPKIEVSSLVIPAEKIYLGRDEDAGYWWANGVVGNMHEANLVKDYSGVAYLKTTTTTEGETVENYQYATSPQSRSVQLVASRVYFGETTSVWEKVKTVYPKMGTEEMPILIGGDEWNTYANLVAKVNGGASQEGVYFELTEDIMADEKLGEDFKGNFVDNGFTVTTYEEIYDNVKTDDFAIELSAVNSNIYGQGSISSIAYNESLDAVEAIFNITKNYQPFDIVVKPTKTQEYYETLKTNGYKYLTLKVQVPAACLWMYVSDSSVGDYRDCDTDAEVANSKILLADGEENAKRYYLGDWGLKAGWHELSISIDRLLNNYGESVNAFRLWITRPSENIVYLGGVYATQNGLAGYDAADMYLTMGSITATTFNSKTGTITADSTDSTTGVRSVTFSGNYLPYDMQLTAGQSAAALKALGYNYVTIKVRKMTKNTNIWITSTSYANYNRIDPANANYEAANCGGVALQDGEAKEKRHELGTYGATGDWHEIALPIDTIYNSNMKIRIWLGWCDATNVTLEIEGVYFTKAGTLASNQA